MRVRIITWLLVAIIAAAAITARRLWARRASARSGGIVLCRTRIWRIWVVVWPRNAIWAKLCWRYRNSGPRRSEWQDTLIDVHGFYELVRAILEQETGLLGYEIQWVSLKTLLR